MTFFLQGSSVAVWGYCAGPLDLIADLLLSPEADLLLPSSLSPEADAAAFAFATACVFGAIRGAMDKIEGALKLALGCVRFKLLHETLGPIRKLALEKDAKHIELCTCS